MEGTNCNDFKNELLSNPSIRKEYEALNPKYDFIQSLVARRIELSLSQRALARKAGMAQPVICRIERGDSNVTVETLFKVTKALDLEIELKPSIA